MNLQDLINAFNEGKDVGWTDNDGRTCLVGDVGVIVKRAKYHKSFTIDGKGLEIEDEA